MTGKRVSAEQVKVMTVFTSDPQGWFDSSDIERRTELPGSSVRHFLFTFMRLGMLDRVETHGGCTGTGFLPTQGCSRTLSACKRPQRQ